MRALGVAGALLVGVGCGQPLASGPRGDEPLLEIDGRVDSEATALHPRLRVALVWVDPLGVWNDRPSPASLEVRTIDPTSHAFTLSLHAPPPPSYIRRFPRRDAPTEVAFAAAFAEIVAYVDDGDETFSVGSRLDGARLDGVDFFAGIATNHVVVYVDVPHDQERDPPAIPEWDALLAGPRGYRLTECQDVGAATRVLVPSTGVAPVIVGASAELQREFPTERSCLASHPSPEL